MVCHLQHNRYYLNILIHIVATAMECSTLLGNQRNVFMLLGNQRNGVIQWTALLSNCNTPISDTFEEVTSFAKN